ncbi:hypothetical protein DFJ43DRAFT_66611 [Lentinula guzmanii]|uniref:Uncharacterized protein n=1 Tax=Lentinula guzmanii TaxID=2804957 RepID=A0AA38JYB9_9AGAR|nr:hypothetical protein DFJ43DRAFT_66611 [Lentinula guzmanii]
MGRALYSQSYAPVIREPTPSQYEKWSINNAFDPDSEEFFAGAQYEAFLPIPTDSRTGDDGPTASYRLSINATRTTMTRNNDRPPRPPRVRISRANPSSSNPMIFDSVPRDLPDMDAPTFTTLPPPVTISDFLDADVETTRPTPSPMAADSDPEDPIRILAGFMNEYRASQSQGDTGTNMDVSEILRRMDERWRREVREAQNLLRNENANRPQRYLPPLSYPSSNASSSSRADSPSSPMFFPSPPSERLPTPPSMSRGEAFVPDSEPYNNPAFHLDEDLEQVERDLLNLESHSLLNTTPSESSTMPVTTAVSIPISQSQTPPRAVRIHHRTPSTTGNEIGLDMSPPPSISPRLYNWSRTRSESQSHSRYDSLSSSPVDFGRRDDLYTVRSIAISEARI